MIAKSDEYRLARICRICDRLLALVRTGEITRESVLSEYKAQWMVSTPLFDIGEQANCLSEEFAASHPDVPWNAIAGLRHRIVHDYEGTNWELVADVVFGEIEPLRDAIATILEKEFGGGGVSPPTG